MSIAYRVENEFYVLPTETQELLLNNEFRAELAKVFEKMVASGPVTCDRLRKLNVVVEDLLRGLLAPEDLDKLRSVDATERVDLWLLVSSGNPDVDVHGFITYLEILLTHAAHFGLPLPALQSLPQKILNSNLLS